MLTRRRLLTGAARLAAGAFGASLLPTTVQRALATPFRRGSFADIKHVVLLMQENRSFDHYFGTMAGVRGFGDPSALMLSGGKSVFHQPDTENPQGYMLPFHLDTRKDTSVLRFLEKFTGVREPNISDWRRNNFGDLTSAFRFDTTAPAPSLKDTSGEASMSKRELSPLPLPGSDQSQALPVQENGRRNRL